MGGAYFFGESLVKSPRREVLRDPRLRMTFITGLYTIDFTTILGGHTRGKFGI